MTKKLLHCPVPPPSPGLTKLVSKLSKEGCWRKALEVYESVEEMGLHSDTALTNAAISAADKGGRWQKALEVFESMERLGLRRDAISYSALISALAKGKQWQLALSVFDHMQAAGVDADVVTCCSLINALERGGQWQLAERCFLQMCTVQEEPGAAAPLAAVAPTMPGASRAASGLPRSQTSPSVVLDGLTRASGGTDGRLPTPLGRGSPPGAGAWEEYQLGSLATPAQGATADIQDLASAFSNSVALNPHPASVCNGGSPASARSPAGTPQPPPERQTSADSMSAVPNPFAAVARLAGAEALMRNSSSVAGSLAGQGIPEDRPFIGDSPPPPPPPPGCLSGATSPAPSAVSGAASPLRAGSLRRDLGAVHHAEASDHLRRAMSCFPDLAERADSQPPQGLATMFNFSHAARVTPNRVCCNALLAAYARAKPPQWQKALHLLNAMWTGGPTLTPDSVSYNTALKACANSFQLGRATDVFVEMSRRGVRPNITTFNCLLAAASDAGQADVLCQVGDWLEHAEPDVRAACLNALVAGLVKVGQWDEAVHRFRGMLEAGAPVPPTASTFNTMLTGYMKLGQYEAVRQVFREMLRVGVSPSIVSFNTLLSAHASLGAWADALDALGAVLAAQLDGISPNTATFNACLAAMVAAVPNLPPQQGPIMAHKALQVFQEMRAQGCAPDQGTFAALIRVLDGTQHAAQVLAVHELMLAAGHTPDAATALTVLRAAVAAGAVHKASGLAHSLLMQGVAVEAGLLGSLLRVCLALETWDLALQLCTDAQVAQGAGAAPLFNAVLHAALATRAPQALVDTLTLMRAAGVEVEANVGAEVLSTGQAGPTPGATAYSPLPPAPIDGPAFPPSFHSLSPLPVGSASAFGTLPGVAVGPSPTSGPTTPALGVPPSAFSLATGSPTSSLSDAQHLPGSPTPPVTLETARSLLEQLREAGDMRSALDVLTHMETAGLSPDATCYSSLVRAAVAAGEPQVAVALVSRAHEAGAMSRYSLPDQSAAGSTEGASALAGVLDLRGCGVDEGVAVLLTWITWLACLAPGLAVTDRAIKIVTDGQGEGGAALRSELLGLLITGETAVPAFRGLVPLALAPDTVSTTGEDGAILELDTGAVYRALLPTAAA